MEKLGATDPQRIGAYRLLGRLGAGGMGQVYLARSDRGRVVAIKLVREELAEQQEFRDRFRKEVQAARRVGSTWTAPVLDADTEAAVPWVATGYVAGPSLQATVSGRASTSAGPAPGAYGPLPDRSVHILGAGLAHALRAIHSAGLIHRDLKPSNILLTIDGPRVIDFGIARALDTVTDGGLTRTGALVGSPGFMSPEQVRGERVTMACDVFCLGSVLAYASTGRLPFGAAASGVHALLFRIAQEEPDLTGVPVDLVELIQDCLRKDPGARPSTDEILERLDEGDSAEPWLPGALIAQLGRHAVGLLDSEDPTDAVPDDVTPDSPPLDAAHPGSTPQHPAPDSTPWLPTAVAPPTPAPAAPPAEPPPPGPPSPTYGYPQLPAQPHPGQGYGYPQQQNPNQGYAYGYPQQPGFGPTPPYGPPHPAGAQPPAPARRSAGSTVALVAIAVLVAIGAGGSVYALMSDRGASTAGPADPSPSDGSSHSPSPDGPQDPSPSDDGQNDDDGQNGNDEGAVPEAYLGTWSGSIDNAAGHSTRELVIQQGQVGEAVLTLTAEGPLDTGGTYHCVFEADLATEPSDGEPVSLGPSAVTQGEPMTSCTPGSATTLTLLPDGTLSRVNTDSGEKLTYTKSG
ncbi:serine/threonine-protein kinase [Streptomyces sp. NBC_01022]|uniref:serine/threonine-protein kinase n=1 Tax=Streptomyces sp. NBC_01022 TaxID=2903723 RepID=UPI002DD8F659|nr:serine/threonine-protein kinase [Streptomyces sp. NBC_01022]WRZ82761.1 serine/threonine protein kinase [Streptomyces sp. NBC_01022]